MNPPSCWYGWLRNDQTGEFEWRFLFGGPCPVGQECQEPAAPGMTEGELYESHCA